MNDLSTDNRSLIDYLNAIAAIEEIPAFIYYDGPLVYLAKDTNGGLVLVYWYDICEVRKTNRWLVVPITEQTVFKLIYDQVSLREAIQQPLVMVVDLENNNDIAGATALDGKTLPDEYLPEPTKNFFFDKSHRDRIVPAVERYFGKTKKA